MSEYVSGNFWLDQSQMEINARYVWDFFQSKGWTINAVAGMLGNMESESTINPGIWQGLEEDNYAGGYGIVQWTPATKFLNWCNDYLPAKNPTSMSANLERVIYEVENHLQWIPTDTYPLSFEEFTQSTATAYELAMAFIANYERPFEPYQPWRGTQAETWFTFLGGLPKNKKRMPLYFYLRRY